MNLSTCPRCSETLRVPEAELPADTYAQCPWCHETYPAEEITQRLPPAVRLLDVHGQPLTLAPTLVGAAAAEANPFAAVMDDADADTVVADTWQEDVADDDEGDQQYIDELNFDSGSGSVDIQVAAPDESSAPSRSKPMQVRTKQPRKKKGSPIRTLVGIALGPVLALPLAGVILLFMGRDINLGFWPFDGSFTRTQQQRSAAPVDSDTSFGFPSNGTQTPRAVKPGGSLLDDDSKVAQAVKDINGSSASGDDSGSSGIGDAKPDSIRLPPSDVDNFAAAERNSEETPEDKVLAEIMNADDASTDAGAAEQLLVPEGVALYPDETQSVSKVPAEPGKTDEGAKAELELKPSSIVIGEPPEAEPIEPKATKSEAPGSNELMIPESSDLVEPAVDPKARVANALRTPPSAEPAPAEMTAPDFPPEAPKAIDSPELVTAVKKASLAIESLQEKRSQSKGTARDLAMTYVAVSEVGTHGAEPGSEALAELLNQISASPLFEDLAKAGPQWWTYKTRPSNGILLVGTASGNRKSPMVTLQGKDSQVSVPVVLPEGVKLPKSGRLIALGLIGSSNDKPAVFLTATQSLP